jgi:DNA modification methylase
MTRDIPYKLLLGDAGEKSKEIPLQVNCVMTSPPYFQKRKYGDSGSEIGQEKDENDFISKLVNIFDSVPLHPLGSVWVNLGDTRDKNGLMMIPEKFAIAMMKNKWRLVDKVIWAKIQVDDDGTTEGGCMIEPAKKRLNGNGHEYLFRFVKDTDAWADTCAVRLERDGVESIRYLPEELMSCFSTVEGRCLHNVWRIGMGQTREKHYAVFPTTLCERPIAMTCPMRVCGTCNHLRTRITEDQEYAENKKTHRVFGKYNSQEETDVTGEKLREAAGRKDVGRQYIPKKPVTTGWTDCGHNNWTSGIVFDPFCGSGTTAEVALKMGRAFIGIDLYQNHLDITTKRCQEVLSFMREKNLDPYLLEK